MTEEINSFNVGNILLVQNINRPGGQWFGFYYWGGAMGGMIAEYMNVL